MLRCIDPQLDGQVQDLQAKSGLPDFELKSQLRHYFTIHDGKLPQLDELDGANSEPYLRKQLKLAKGKTGQKSDLFNFLQLDSSQNSFQDAIITLNDQYRDLEIEGREYGDRYSLNIKKRPSIVSSINPNIEIQDSQIDTQELLREMVGKLQDLYGINVYYATEDDLREMLPNTSDIDFNAMGFIYNGNIYVKTKGSDGTTVDNPDKIALHEFMHLILGSIKSTNRSLYENLLGTIASNDRLSSAFQTWAESGNGVSYTNRTQTDLLEEFMVQSMTEYLTQTDSSDNVFKTICENDKETAYQLKYNMYRVLDSIFDGSYSVRSISDRQLFNFSLKQVAAMVNSSILNNSFKGSITDAQINRIASNYKQKMMESKDENNQLTQDCS